MSIDKRATTGPASPEKDADLHEEARRRVEQKRGFWVHLAIYLAINGLLVAVWAWTGAPFFWPVIPLVLWGIGLAANAWAAFVERPITEQRIQQEIDRMRR